jgi:hypothetical protein
MLLPVAERLHWPHGTPSGRDLYHLAFIRNCHRWLAAGYAMLNVRSLSRSQEPAITGELVRAMKEAKLKADAPTWMIRMYVADDPPVNAPGRLGKHRRRVDIEFERSERGVTFHFHCEAKRLYRSDSVVEYFGKEGLGMFLAGEYARDEDVGGMLGYVQSEGMAEWMARLRAALANDHAKYTVTSDGALEIAALLPELPQIHRSRHERLAVGRPILIFHTLLVFTNSDST